MSTVEKFKVYAGTFLSLCLALFLGGVIALLLLRTVAYAIGYDPISGYTFHGFISWKELIEFSVVGGIYGLVFNIPALIITYPISFILVRNNIHPAIIIPILIVWFTLIGIAYEIVMGRELLGFYKVFFCAGIPTSILIWLFFKRIIAGTKKI